VRQRRLEALTGVKDLPWIAEWRRFVHQSDRLLDDRDNRLLEVFEEAHARAIAKQQFPCRRVVAMNNADGQFTRSNGQ
jgi:hypothetical protein